MHRCAAGYEENRIVILGVRMPKSIADASVAFETAAQPVQTEFSFGNVPALCVALRAGDEGAYAWLYQTWSSRINRYCFVLAKGDERLCSEIAQAAWIRLSRSIRELPNETALWNWITCAARHSMIDLQRGRMRYAISLVRFWEWFASPTESKPEVDDADELLSHALDKVLTNLGKNERRLIEKRYFAEASLDDIASECSLTVRAVEGRLARLRVRLRRALADELKKTQI